MSEPKPQPSEEEVRRQSRRQTLRSFAVGAAAIMAGSAGLRWLVTREADDDLPWPLRRMHNFNEALSRAAFSKARLAPQFPAKQAVAAEEMRENGGIGLGENFDEKSWSLTVENDGGEKKQFTLADVKEAPRSEMIVQLKCIEGWSQVISWGGTTLLAFLTQHHLGTRSGKAPDPEGNPADFFPYAAMETPDGRYYVGLDMASALHPQTLLCYEMGGEPLTSAHGAPLRLAIPVKYGIKNIKRIGRIRFTDERPRDYWAERGYDWYSGH